MSVDALKIKDVLMEIQDSIWNASIGVHVHLLIQDLTQLAMRCWEPTFMVFAGDMCSLRTWRVDETPDCLLRSTLRAWYRCCTSADSALLSMLTVHACGSSNPKSCFGYIASLGACTLLDGRFPDTSRRAELRLEAF